MYLTLLDGSLSDCLEHPLCTFESLFPTFFPTVTKIFCVWSFTEMNYINLGSSLPALELPPLRTQHLKVLLTCRYLDLQGNCVSQLSDLLVRAGGSWAMAQITCILSF